MAARELVEAGKKEEVQQLISHASLLDLDEMVS